MDKSLLISLRDIHLPKEIGYSPLGLGWYILIGLILLILISLGLSYYYIYQKRLIYKKALITLKSYKKDYQDGKAVVLIASHLSEWLRQVALTYYPKENVAGLKGSLWIAFLVETGFGDLFQHDPTLLDIPYQRTSLANLNPWFDACEKWIHSIQMKSVNKKR